LRRIWLNSSMFQNTRFTKNIPCFGSAQFHNPPKQSDMKTIAKRVVSMLTLAALLTVSTSELSAQIGSGWTQKTFSERFEYETNDILFTISPPPSVFNDASLHYDNTSGVETFKLLKHKSNRAEIRPNDDY